LSCQFAQMSFAIYNVYNDYTMIYISQTFTVYIICNASAHILY
jgi:hypothetical protein